MPDSISDTSIVNEVDMELENIDNINSDNNNNRKENKNSVEYKVIKENISSVEKFKNFLQKENPQTLENFEIVELIGSGSESVVFKVILKKTKQPFVMKLILFNNKKRNINEYQISRTFKNKNIISVYGIYQIEKDKLDYILMEYAKFGNLRDFQKNVIKRNELSEELLCFLAVQILTALQYCHKCQVVHYDLKPQNITIDEYLNVKLIDFSVSLDYSKLNSKKIRLPYRGTNFYMAPEVIESKEINIKDINKIDLFSLGVILYNLAFGSYPFGLTHDDAKNYDSIYYKIQNNELEYNNQNNYYSEYFIDFLEKLLRKDINKRININQAMNHHWIKAADILMDEKEKTFNAGSFLINLLTDHIRNFENYVHK